MPKWHSKVLYTLEDAKRGKIWILKTKKESKYGNLTNYIIINSIQGQKHKSNNNPSLLEPFRSGRGKHLMSLIISSLIIKIHTYFLDERLKTYIYILSSSCQ